MVSGSRWSWLALVPALPFVWRAWVAVQHGYFWYDELVYYQKAPASLRAAAAFTLNDNWQPSLGLALSLLFNASSSREVQWALYATATHLLLACTWALLTALLLRATTRPAEALLVTAGGAVLANNAATPLVTMWPATGLCAGLGCAPLLGALALALDDAPSRPPWRPVAITALVVLSSTAYSGTLIVAPLLLAATLWRRQGLWRPALGLVALAVGLVLARSIVVGSALRPTEDPWRALSPLALGHGALVAVYNVFPSCRSATSVQLAVASLALLLGGVLAARSSTDPRARALLEAGLLVAGLSVATLVAARPDSLWPTPPIVLPSDWFAAPASAMYHLFTFRIGIVMALLASALLVARVLPARAFVPLIAGYLSLAALAGVEVARTLPFFPTLDVELDVRRERARFVAEMVTALEASAPRPVAPNPPLTALRRPERLFICPPNADLGLRLDLLLDALGVRVPPGTVFTDDLPASAAVAQVVSEYYVWPPVAGEPERP